MASYKTLASAQCPFIKDDFGSTIVCEGITKGSTIKLSFRGAENYKTYRDTYCCKSYKKCEVFAAVMRAKYGGMDE